MEKSPFVGVSSGTFPRCTMFPLTRRSLRWFAVFVALVAANSHRLSAQEPYMRMRPGAADWSQRGGPNAWGPGHGGFAPYAPYGNYYGGAVAVSGSWYERPYPHHLDYYRYRWGAPPNAAPQCPCEAATVQFGEPGPTLAEPQVGT